MRQDNLGTTIHQNNLELQSLTVVFSLERKRKPRLGMQPFDLEEIGKDIQRAPEFGPDGY